MDKNNKEKWTKPVLIVLKPSNLQEVKKLEEKNGKECLRLPEIPDKTESDRTENKLIVIHRNI